MGTSHLYKYLGSGQCHVMCKLCDFRVPTLEMYKLEEHLLDKHFYKCYSCKYYCRGHSCNERFINYELMFEHRRQMKDPRFNPNGL